MKKNSSALQTGNNQNTKVHSPVKYFSGGVFSAILFISVLALLFVAGYRLNIGNIKESTIVFMGVKQDQEKRLDQRQKEIEKMLEEIEDSMDEIISEQIRIEQKQVKLNEKEEELIIWQERLSEEQMGIEQVIAIYKEMNPQFAAEILALNPESPHTLVVLKNLDEKKAADILSYMTPETASLIIGRTSE